MADTAVSPPTGDSSTPNTADEYIHTTTHNYISRAATIEGARQVELKGRSVIAPQVHFHGHRAVIRVGRYCRFDTGAIVVPPTMPDTENEYIPPTIGSKTWIGANTKSQAAAIGSLCWIGRNVTLGQRVILKDCVVIADDTVVPADTVVPPFSHIRFASQQQQQQRLVRTELPPASSHALEEQALEYYQSFHAEQSQEK